MSYVYASPLNAPITSKPDYVEQKNFTHVEPEENTYKHPSPLATVKSPEVEYPESLRIQSARPAVMSASAGAATANALVALPAEKCCIVVVDAIVLPPVAAPSVANPYTSPASSCTQPLPVGARTMFRLVAPGMSVKSASVDACTVGAVPPMVTAPVPVGLSAIERAEPPAVIARSASSAPRRVGLVPPMVTLPAPPGARAMLVPVPDASDNAPPAVAVMAPVPAKLVNPVTAPMLATPPSDTSMPPDSTVSFAPKKPFSPTASPPTVFSDAAAVEPVATTLLLIVTAPTRVDAPVTDKVPLEAMLPPPVVLMSPGTRNTR